MTVFEITTLKIVIYSISSFICTVFVLLWKLPLLSSLAAIVSLTVIFLSLAAVLQHEVSTKMQEVGSSFRAVTSVDELFLGQLCCARYSEDGTWYRAVIQQLDGEKQTVKVI